MKQNKYAVVQMRRKDKLLCCEQKRLVTVNRKTK